MGVEECGAGVFEPGDGFLRREVDGVLPAADGDAAGPGVDGEAEGVLAERALEIRGELEADELVAAFLRGGIGFGFGRAEVDALDAMGVDAVAGMAVYSGAMEA